MNGRQSLDTKVDTEPNCEIILILAYSVFLQMIEPQKLRMNHPFHFELWCSFNSMRNGLFLPRGCKLSTNHLGKPDRLSYKPALYRLLHFPRAPLQ